MLRILSLAVLTAIAAPSYATDMSDDTVIAQQQQPPQPAPKRSKRKRDEGVSSRTRFAVATMGMLM